LENRIDILRVHVQTVVVCDSEPVAMEGLRSLLASKDGPRVVAMETRLPEATDAIRQLRQSILVAGKELGIGEVLGLLRLIRAEDLPTARGLGLADVRNRGSPLSAGRSFGSDSPDRLP
jgi:hypothetical protein